MAIGVTHLLTDGSNANGDSYTTASISPSANKLLVVGYASMQSAVTPRDITTSLGLSLSWSEIKDFIWDDSSPTGNGRGRMWLLAADTGGSPGSGTLFFDHGTGEDNLRAAWSIFELSGTDLGTSTVAQCFVQSPTTVLNEAAASSLSITLGAAGASENRPFLWKVMGGGAATTPRASWTEIADYNPGGENFSAESQWRSDAFETTASATWSGTFYHGGIAFEVKASTAAVTTTRKLRVVTSPLRW
jgi:hypothetical protein